MLRHNYDIWAGYEKNIWWETLDLAANVMQHYSLAEIRFDQIETFIKLCFDHFEEGIQSNERKDQQKIATLLFYITKDIRLLQFSMKIELLISQFECLFVKRLR